MSSWIAVGMIIMVIDVAVIVLFFGLARRSPLVDDEPISTVIRPPPPECVRRVPPRILRLAARRRGAADAEVVRSAQPHYGPARRSLPRGGPFARPRERWPPHTGLRICDRRDLDDRLNQTGRARLHRRGGRMVAGSAARLADRNGAMRGCRRLLQGRHSRDQERDPPGALSPESPAPREVPSGRRQRARNSGATFPFRP
jgi:hypothetical protein